MAERLLAVQGQDPRGARLAVRARTAGLAAADVDRALSEDRSLLITWLNRGTLHLVRSEDYPWLQALTTPPLMTERVPPLARRKLTEAAAERAMKTIERALTEEGPLTRAQLRERLDAAGVRTEGQALVHLLLHGGSARDRRAWPDGRQAARLRADPRLARAAAARSTATSPLRSWPAATWSGTVRPTTATSPAGRACRCATPAPVSPRSRSELVEREDGLVDLSEAAAAGAAAASRGCSAPSTRCCSAGPRAPT